LQLKTTKGIQVTQKRTWKVGAAALLAAALVACGEEGAPKISSDEIDAIMALAGKLEPLAVEDDKIVGEPIEEEEGDFRYTYETHDVVENIESVLYLGLNDDVIWPGSMILGAMAHSFVYDPVTLPRAPITLSVSLELSSTGDSITEVVRDPRLSTVRQGISDLLAEAVTEDTSVPAKVDFLYEEVFSQSQMDLFFGTDLSYGAGSLQTQFDFESTVEKTRIVAKYQQVYFTIDMDTPRNASAFFPSNTDPEELAEAIPEGSNPLYVAGVSYGLMAIMTIESNFSSREVRTALKAAYEAGVADLELEFDSKDREVLEDSTIKIIVYGGSTQNLDRISGGFEGFMDIVSASHEFTPESPGVPLAYKFRHVRDNTLALVTLTSQYTLVRPLRIKQRVQITVDRFVTVGADDEGPDNTIEMDDFRVYVDAFNRFSTSEPLSPITNGRQEVYGFHTGGDISMREGTVWFAVGSTPYIVTFNTEIYDFDLAELHFSGTSREWDGGGPFDSDPDHGSNKTPYNLQGEFFLDGGSEHHFNINGSDASHDVYFNIELLD